MKMSGSVDCFPVYGICILLLWAGSTSSVSGTNSVAHGSLVWNISIWKFIYFQCSLECENKSTIHLDFHAVVIATVIPWQSNKALKVNAKFSCIHSGTKAETHIQVINLGYKKISLKNHP